MGVACDGADVKQGGHSLRCCVQPLALKLKWEGGGNNFAEMLFVSSGLYRKNVVHVQQMLLYRGVS